MTSRAILFAAVAGLMAQPALAQSARFGGFNLGGTIATASVQGGGQGGTTRGAFGINGGYNWAFGNNFLAGVVGNYATLGGPNGGQGGPNIRNIRALRLQAGYAFGDTAVFFGFGRAQAQMGGGGGHTTNTAAGHGGNAHNGTVASFGIQHALSNNLSFLVEYSAYRFNSGGGNGQGGPTPAAAPGGGGGGPRSDQLTVGFTFTF